MRAQHSREFRGRGRAWLAAIALAVVGTAMPAHAQDMGRGFLFGAPSGSFALRGGYATATAGSDIFAFVQQELTLKHSDFNGLNLGADASLDIAPRWDLSLSAAVTATRAGSEFRNYTDQNQQAITQSTEFRRVPVTLNLKYYLEPRGRSIGHYAWIPAKVTPYIGGGAGFMYYRFHQDGDFIDYSTMNVFPDTYESSGWAPAVQALGGLDYSLSPMVALSTEGRYIWSNASLSNDFSGFHRIDLSGFSVTAGVYFRF